MKSPVSSPKTCQNHQFFEVEKINRTGWNEQTEAPREFLGVKVVCAVCGEVREILENGQVNILIPNKRNSLGKPTTAEK